MRNLTLAILLLLTWPRGLRAAEIAWQTDYQASMDEAVQAGKPVLLCFTATWCGPCRLMHTTTFTDPEVLEAMRSLIAVKIDFDQNAELIGKYHIQGVPTLILTNRFGEIVATQVGYLEAKSLLAWLATNRAAAAVQTSKAQIARDKATALNALLESKDSTEREGGIAQLLTSYRTKDDLAPIAGKWIADLVERRRDELLPHLNDEHLAVRILLANLLSKKEGAKLGFDPWAPAAERQTAMQALPK